jgi:hypothetical protein
MIVASHHAFRPVARGTTAGQMALAHQPARLPSSAARSYFRAALFLFAIEAQLSLLLTLMSEDAFLPIAATAVLCGVGFFIALFLALIAFVLDRRPR